jgi:nicotinamidase/pyrazinamidase
MHALQPRLLGVDALVNRALIIVDMQYDFLPGGALAVPGADEIIPGIVDLIRSDDYDMIVTTQDWHPQHSQHFDRWPVHCVAGTHGAQLETRIRQAVEDWVNEPGGLVRITIHKGLGNADGYSGFDTGKLHQVLVSEGIRAVDIVGVAGDYCVRATASDAVALGYETNVIEDLVRCVG